jgi:hypothetical protein
MGGVTGEGCTLLLRYYEPAQGDAKNIQGGSSNWSQMSSTAAVEYRRDPSEVPTLRTEEPESYESGSFLILLPD